MFAHAESQFGLLHCDLGVHIRYLHITVVTRINCRKTIVDYHTTPFEPYYYQLNIIHKISAAQKAAGM